MWSSGGSGATFYRSCSFALVASVACEALIPPPLLPLPCMSHRPLFSHGCTAPKGSLSWRDSPWSPRQRGIFTLIVNELMKVNLWFHRSREKGRRFLSRRKAEGGMSSRDEAGWHSSRTRGEISSAKSGTRALLEGSRRCEDAKAIFFLVDVWKRPAAQYSSDYDSCCHARNDSFEMEIYLKILLCNCL